MASQSWPSDPFPQNPRRKGYGESYGNQTARFETDAGPAKTRRRHSARTDSFTVEYYLSDTNKTTWENFLDNTIAGGALKFDWPHPSTGGTVEARLVIPPEPSIIPFGDEWILRCSIEVLP